MHSTLWSSNDVRPLGLLVVMQMVRLLPDAITYDAAISACREAQQWHRALCLLATMQMAHLPSDAIIYYVAIRACVKPGNGFRD